MAKTKIEWCDTVWNPVTGCTKVSEGCRNCYAERMAKRLAGRFGYPAVDPFKVTLHEDRLVKPLSWKKPRRLFVDSMGDLFHEDVSENYIVDIFAIMFGASRHKFLILTKRSKRMYKFVSKWFGEGKTKVLENVWLGISVEDQETADERIPLLLQTPAAVRFVSIEPMLGAIDLRDLPLNKATYVNSLTGRERFDGSIKGFSTSTGIHLDWVICGGETGPGARPMHPDWVRSIRDQCQETHVPFFFKGWGEWIPYDHKVEGMKYTDWGCLNLRGEYFNKTSNWDGRQGDPRDNYEQTVYRVGKNNAGRLLDGRTWEEVPGGK